MKKLQGSFQLLIIFFLVLLITFITLSSLHYKKDSSFLVNSELSKFKTDLVNASEDSQIYSKDLSKKEKYIAYSTYLYLGHGDYTAAFSFKGPDKGNTECIIEIVSGKGKKVEIRSDRKKISGESIIHLKFTLSGEKEVEPRVRYIEGSKNIILQKVTIKRTKYIFPVWEIFLRTLYLVPIFFLSLISFYFALSNDERWRFYLAMFLTYAGIFLIIKFAWMSEDALITLRHVDNFLSGNGAVFNPGERVEGYTHTLWFWLVTLFRAIGLPPKGSMVLPGVLFSIASLYLLFFALWRGKYKKAAINFSGALLIGMSSFIDFGTSGLESSLSYLLLIVFSIFISRGWWEKHPAALGLIVTLMTFNRPDFGIFLIFGLLFYSFYYIKKRIKLKIILLYGLPPVILLGIYEVFRMGYYGSVFPNPFFAKSGSSSYFSQGILYLGDLIKGSSFLIIIVLALLVLLLKRGKADFSARGWILGAGLFYGFFVIRGGGDFMHGRFLLPAVILIAISSSGAFDNFFDKNTLRRTSAVFLIFTALLISITVIPVQKRGGKIYNHGIADERFTFYQNKIFPLNQLLADNHIFMWKTIGNNYHYLTERAKKKIKIAYHTVGFIGYYSGPRVNVVDRLGLTDPVLARRKIEKRGRPGHEKSAPFGYLVYRELTFGETPFRIWNELAGTKYGVLWDLSRGTLSRFSFFLDKNFKTRLDSGIINFLKEKNRKSLKVNADLLFFLKKFWYPFAPPEGKDTFNLKYNEKTIVNNSDSFRWIKKNREQIIMWDSVIKGKLTKDKFLKNIIFAIKDYFK